MAIEVLRGSRDALESACRRRAKSAGERTLWLVDHDRRGWGATRWLLSQLGDRLPPETYRAALETHAGALSLLLSPQSSRVTAIDLGTPELAPRRRFLGASATSHLSHNWILQRPIFEDIGDLLAELLAAADFLLLVPSVNRLDFEDAVMLKYLNKRPRPAAQMIGHELLYEPSADSDGIVWELSPVTGDRVVLGLLARPGVAAEEVSGGDRWRPPIDGEPPMPAVAGDAFETLAGTEGDTDWKAVVAGLRAAFRGLAYTSTLRLGLDLLSRRPPLTPRQAADVHKLIALAAHNRQFRSEGNRPLARFIEGHLEAALATEDRSAQRSALHYRMAVTRARRLNDYQGGSNAAKRAIEAAQKVETSPLLSAYLEAWGYNIQAYVLSRTGSLDDAIRCTAQAFDLLDREIAAVTLESADRDLGAFWRDARASHSLLAHNLTALAKIAGKDTEFFAPWQRRTAAAIATLPAVDKVESDSWIDFFQRSTRADLALEHALTGLGESRDDFDPALQCRYAAQAATAYSELGDAGGVEAMLTSIRTIRRRCRLSIAPGLDLQIALARLRSGKIESARTDLRKVLATLANDATGARAEVLALAAIAAAEGGDEAAAERTIDLAIDLAVETGERDVQLRIANAWGQTYQRLGRQGEAREAYRRALEVAGAAETDAAPPPASDLLVAAIGEIECDGISARRLRNALDLVPAALRDADFWWHLARLIRVLAVVDRQWLAAPELAPMLTKVVTAANQREDCAPLLEALRARLPANTIPTLAAVPPTRAASSSDRTLDAKPVAV